MRPLISWGEANSVMVLCMVLKPDWPNPPMASKVNANAYHGDQTKAIAITIVATDPNANIRSCPGPMSIFAQATPPGPGALLARKEAEKMAGDVFELGAACDLPFNVRRHLLNDCMPVRHYVVSSATESLLQLGQEPRILIGLTTDHHTIDMLKVSAALVDGGNATIQNNHQIRKFPFQFVDALVVQ